MTFPNFPELTNLRHLAVSAYGGYDDDLLVLTSLIDASPSLNKLSLEVMFPVSSYTLVTKVFTSAFPHKTQLITYLSLLFLYGCSYYVVSFCS